jgi:hypothetical protein
VTIRMGCGCWFERFQYHFCPAASMLINEAWEPGMNVVLRGAIEDAVRDHFEEQGIAAAVILAHVGAAQRSAKRSGREAYVP